MADNEEEIQKQVLEAFARIGTVWGQARKGIIVSFNGVRVGTWVWQKSRMLVKSETKDFKTLIQDMQKNGILVQEPAEALGTPEDELLPGPATSLVSIPFGSAAPGVLDHALKLEGYYLLDLAIPLVKEK